MKYYSEPPPSMPRVVNKLNLCFNPGRDISPIAADISGLDNELLGDQSHFDSDSVNIMKSFLQRLPAPVCLIAHNGYRFDFPILREEISKATSPLWLAENFPDILCADSLWACMVCV